ncbi:MAG TPA: glycosyltransferase family 39 protein [Alphaproteobacteria bacterium]|nr:glycosyltransferase family 39 protein [Alphaproteobacteria bacterium]
MTGEAEHSLWPSRIIVLVTGLMVGFFLWRTYLGDAPRLYPVEFTQGQWLIAADEAPQGYFRHELYIPSAILQAWVVVAATDSFILYVNGKAVDGKGYASLNVSGIYDIGQYLLPGKNVVGVVARRLSYPGPAMAAIEGVYRDQTGREHVFATDATWKVSPVEQTQGWGEIPWYAEAFDATAWKSAKAAHRPASSEIYPLGVPAQAFAMPPHGQWIGQADYPMGQATFTYTITLPAKVEDAWMRLAASTPYALAINGIAIEGGDTPRDVEVMRLLRFQGTPLWRNHDGPSTELYRIAPLLRAGANRITVSLGQHSASIPSFYMDGFVVSHGEVRPFGRHAAWTVTSPSLTSDHATAQYHAIAMAHVAPEHKVLPVKQAMTVILPLSYTATRLLMAALVLILTASGFYLLWGGSSRLLFALGHRDRLEVSKAATLAHFPILLILGGLYLVSFDVRLDPSFPFQNWTIALSAAVLLIIQAILMLEAWYHRHRQLLESSSPSPPLETGARIGTALLLIALVAAGAFLRLRNLDAQSLYHDEIHMVTYVQGLLEKGYPHKMIGPIERPLATYELAPYPIALSVLLFGMSDFTLRLPAALFGILTIPLIYVVGQQIFDRRVGLLAAAIYTFCPQALIWAQYLWHPQQTQFFALLTSFLFYQAIRQTPLSPRYLYAAAVAFIATYLSWEGSGFFLPALGLAVAVVKGKDLSWLRDKHLWMAVGIVSVAVAVQLIRRVLLQVPYLVIGQGLSDVSMPTLYFLDPMYDPIFYIKNFLWVENNVVLTLLVFSPLPYLLRCRGFVYYLTILLSVLFLMTNTLSNSAIRYVYYLQTFLILLSSSSVISTIDHVAGRKECIWFKTCQVLKYAMAFSLSVLIIFATSHVLKLYRVSNFSFPSGIHTRTDVYYIDYRTAAQYVKSLCRDDDLVIDIVADALKYYSGLESQYFVQSYTMRQVFYDPSDLSPRYLERIVGNPIIRDFVDLQEILNNYRRVWIIAAPESIFTRMAGPEIRGYLQRKGSVAYESYNVKVYLVQN